MEMHQIRYFLSVCETLNFTRSAEACNVAQPSLTRAIKKLEDELGGELFHRERSRTHLTELGRTMLPLLTNSYQSVQAAKTQAESFGRAEITSLRLGLSQTVDIRLLLPTLNELNRAFPALQLQLMRGTADQIESRLEAGDIEVAVTARDHPQWDRIDQWSLFAERFMVAMKADDPLAAHAALRLEQIVDRPMLLRTDSEQIDRLHSLLQKGGLNLESCHGVNSNHDQAILLRHGFGVGLVPKSVSFDDTAIVCLPLSEELFTREVSVLAVAGRRFSEAAGLFIKMLRAADWSERETAA